MSSVSESYVGQHSKIVRYLIWVDIGLFKSIEVVMNGLKAMFNLFTFMEKTRKNYIFLTILVALSEWHLALTMEMEQGEADIYSYINIGLTHGFSVLDPCSL